MFFTTLYDRDHARIADSAGLRLAPRRWSDMGIGGPDKATIDVSGPREAMRFVTRWLRYEVEIGHDSWPHAWHGYIHAVDVRIGPITYRLTLDDVANYISVLYTFTDVDGGLVDGQTTWGANWESIGRYGYHELRHSDSDLSADLAEALRNRLLGDLGLPVATIEIEDDSEYFATLYCRGLWHTFDWRYYTSAVGREDYIGGSAEQPLGLGFSSDDIGFTTDEVAYEHDGQFANFEPGYVIRVSGSASNDGAYTVDSGNTADTQAAYSANTIYFEIQDDILDNNEGLAFIRSGEYIEISGSASNSGFHLISSMDPNHVTTRGYTGNIVAETVGPSITIRQGGSITVVESMANEAPGEASGVTVTAYGERVAQQVQNNSGAAYTVNRIGIKLKKVGSPSDDVIVEFCADSGGSPGSVLDSATVDPADIGTSMLWHWIDMANTVSFATGTDYWIVVRRDGANEPSDGYRVGLNEDAGYSSGTLLVYDGASWWTRSPAADMAFRVWGATETTAQIAEMLTAGNQFAALTEVRTDSSIEVNQFRDGLSTARDEVETLVAMGTDGGESLGLTVTHGRAVVVDVRPDDTAPELVLGRDGRLRWRHGGVIEPGRLVAGRWVEIDDPPSNDGLVVLTPIYVASSEYDANSGRLAIRPAGAPDPFEIGGIRQG